MLTVLAVTLAVVTAAPAAGSRGGGLDTRPRLVQTSHFDGTTAVGQLPRVQFHGRNAEGPLTETLATRLAGSARFIGSAGESIPAVAEVGPSQLGGWTFTVELSPARPLDRDRWYTLEVLRELALVVGTAEESENLDGDSMRVRLYTGSGPRIRRLVVADDPAKPLRTVDVLLSEPADLGAVSDGFEATLDGAPLTGCVAWEGQCVKTAQRGVRTGGFSFLLEKPLVGRRLATGQTRVRALGGESLIPAGGWRPCAGDPGSRCAPIAR